MSVGYDLLILLFYPVFIGLIGLGLYWVIRLAVRAAIRDTELRRGRETDGRGPVGP